MADEEAGGISERLGFEVGLDDKTQDPAKRIASGYEKLVGKMESLGDRLVTTTADQTKEQQVLFGKLEKVIGSLGDRWSATADRMIEVMSRAEEEVYDFPEQIKPPIEKSTKMFEGLGDGVERLRVRNVKLFDEVRTAIATGLIPMSKYAQDNVDSYARMAAEAGTSSEAVKYLTENLARMQTPKGFDIMDREAKDMGIALKAAFGKSAEAGLAFAKANQSNIERVIQEYNYFGKQVPKELEAASKAIDSYEKKEKKAFGGNVGDLIHRIKSFNLRDALTGMAGAAITTGAMGQAHQVYQAAGTSATRTMGGAGLVEARRKQAVSAGVSLGIEPKDFEAITDSYDRLANLGKKDIGELTEVAVNYARATGTSMEEAGKHVAELQQHYGLTGDALKKDVAETAALAKQTGMLPTELMKVRDELKFTRFAFDGNATAANNIAAGTARAAAEMSRYGVASQAVIDRTKSLLEGGVEDQTKTLQGLVFGGMDPSEALALLDQVAKGDEDAIKKVNAGLNKGAATMKGLVGEGAFQQAAGREAYGQMTGMSGAEYQGRAAAGAGKGPSDTAEKIDLAADKVAQAMKEFPDLMQEAIRASNKIESAAAAAMHDSYDLALKAAGKLNEAAGKLAGGALGLGDKTLAIMGYAINAAGLLMSIKSLSSFTRTLQESLSVFRGSPPAVVKAGEMFAKSVGGAGESLAGRGLLARFTSIFRVAGPAAGEAIGEGVAGAGMAARVAAMFGSATASVGPMFSQALSMGAAAAGPALAIIVGGAMGLIIGKKINDNIQKVVETNKTFRNFWYGMWDLPGTVIVQLEHLGEDVKRWGNTVGVAARMATESVTKWASKHLGEVKAFALSIFDGLASQVAGAFGISTDQLKSKLMTPVDILQKKLYEVGDWMKTFFPSLGDILKGTFSGIFKDLKEAVASVIPDWLVRKMGLLDKEKSERPAGVDRTEVQKNAGKIATAPAPATTKAPTPPPAPTGPGVKEVKAARKKAAEEAQAAKAKAAPTPAVATAAPAVPAPVAPVVVQVTPAPAPAAPPAPRGPGVKEVHAAREAARLKTQTPKTTEAPAVTPAQDETPHYGKQIVPTNVEAYRAMAEKSAAKWGIPVQGLLAQIRKESSGDRLATSKVGAKGLMQFMPDAAKQYGIAGKEYDPESSIEAGAHYMADLKKQFGGDLKKASMAYNVGPTNLNKILAGKRWGKKDKNFGMPQETAEYGEKVGNAYLTAQAVGSPVSPAVEVPPVGTSGPLKLAESGKGGGPKAPSAPKAAPFVNKPFTGVTEGESNIVAELRKLLAVNARQAAILETLTQRGAAPATREFNEMYEGGLGG